MSEISPKLEPFVKNIAHKFPTSNNLCYNECKEESVSRKVALKILCGRLNFAYRRFWRIETSFVSGLNPSIVWFSIWAMFFAMWLFVGLQPAEAKTYDISSELKIPSIALTSNVTNLQPENGELKTPENLVGSYTRGNTTLLIGHSTTVFQDLHNASIGDEITYGDDTYNIYSAETIAKNDISMNQLLKSSDEPQLILMTCAGELYGNGDSAERLIVKAIKL